MPVDSQDQFRAECEARYWLKVTRGEKSLVDERMASIAKKRGQAAADRLREGMVAEWKRRKGVA